MEYSTQRAYKKINRIIEEQIPLKIYDKSSDYYVDLIEYLECINHILFVCVFGFITPIIFIPSS